MGHELSHKTIGIVGLGRIGSLVAKFASAFGMEVLAFDPYVEESAFTKAESQRDHQYKSTLEYRPAQSGLIKVVTEPCSGSGNVNRTIEFNCCWVHRRRV